MKRMADDPDYIVELPGVEDAAASLEEPRDRRKWIGVRFECCGTYQRIYRNRSGTAYEGRCPRCLRLVRALIGPGGTSARFFVAE
ncbi:MAG TPA: hypothetical protein P5572_06360 [Phycisphaerae bacterium]|nr:hypothetical protein [Phycisphaerae bacterium]